MVYLELLFVLYTSFFEETFPNRKSLTFTEFQEKLLQQLTQDGATTAKADTDAENYDNIQELKAAATQVSIALSDMLYRPGISVRQHAVDSKERLSVILDKLYT